MQESLKSQIVVSLGKALLFHLKNSERSPFSEEDFMLETHTFFLAELMPLGGSPCRVSVLCLVKSVINMSHIECTTILDLFKVIFYFLPQ